MPDYPLRCDVRRTESTLGLLTQLHCSETGFEPYLLTAWSPVLTAPDTVTLPHLAELLDEPLALRKPRTGHAPARRLGRWARLHNDADFAHAVCANFAHDHGLEPPQ